MHNSLCLRTSLIAAMGGLFILMLACFAAAEDTLLPTTTFPPFQGERYNDKVPDTLDLAERMKLSLNALTRCVDECCPKPFPPTKYRSNHFILLKPEGPEVFRNVNLYGKAMLGALFARMATGIDERMEIDNNWRSSWLSWQEINPIMHGPEGGRRMEWIAMNYRNESGANRTAWKALANRATARLEQQVDNNPGKNWILSGHIILDDGYESHSEALNSRDKQRANREKHLQDSMIKGWHATYMTWTVQGLCALYRETGEQEALELAGRLVKYLKDDAEIITPEGRFLAEHEHDFPNIHWHHSFQVAIASAEYGLVAGDREFIQFANTAYQHGLSLGSREIGFAPEYCYEKFPRDQDFDNTEACCTADLVLTALWLTLSGEYDYWDDIDRFTRNQLAELQMTDTRWFYELPENRGKWRYPNPEVEAMIAPLVGNFGGWSTPNEWHIPELGCGIMTCCLGNCTRAMYYVWENMVQFSDDELTLHLMLNRASPWADIHSYRPIRGKLEVKVKQNLSRLRVRAPEWIPTESELLVASREGQKDSLKWEARYVVVEDLRAGDTVLFEFPLREETIQTNIGRQDFTLTFRGNTIVDIQPPGERIPLYRRDSLKTEDVPMRTVERFLINND